MFIISWISPDMNRYTTLKTNMNSEKNYRLYPPVV